jgi:Putative MetA-pathway of phenol degradation
VNTGVQKAKLSPVNLNHYVGIACLLLLAGVAVAQELEPRRWSHLPVGANFLGVGYAYTETDIFFNPTLEIEDASSEVHTAIVSYVRVLDVFGKSGRFDLLLPYSAGRWEGLLEGQPASTRRSGFADPKFRFAVNLLGSPAQSLAEFSQFEVNTIVGAALEVTAPVGNYREDKLINLGANRWSFRPQIGVVHNRKKWAAEVTVSAWFYTDNDEFTGDKRWEKDPLFAVQSHLIYTFRPGLWASLSGAYGGGARSTIDGVEIQDKTEKFLWAASFGFPINPHQGIKIAYMRGDTKVDTGNDFDRFILAYSMMWGGK